MNTLPEKFFTSCFNLMHWAPMCRDATTVDPLAKTPHQRKIFPSCKSYATIDLYCKRKQPRHSGCSYCTDTEPYAKIPFFKHPSQP
jgi:hypothetical protein